jgi:hypothetical protein
MDAPIRTGVIAAAELSETAEAQAQQAVQRLLALNEQYGDGPSPVMDPQRLGQTFARQYARFVARWFLVKP